MILVVVDEQSVRAGARNAGASTRAPDASAGQNIAAERP
jgi:hypothetical protein